MACRPLLEPIRSCPCLIDGDFECYQTICPGVIEDLSECYDDHAEECFGEFSGFPFFVFLLFFFFCRQTCMLTYIQPPANLALSHCRWYSVLFPERLRTPDTLIFWEKKKSANFFVIFLCF
jgi:hypothetical protein